MIIINTIPVPIIVSGMLALNYTITMQALTSTGAEQAPAIPETLTAMTGTHNGLAQIATGTRPGQTIVFAVSPEPLS